MELTPDKFFFDIPIYTKIVITDENWSEFMKIFTHSTLIEGYNPKRKVRSTFIIESDLMWNDAHFVRHGGFETICIKCKRYDDIFRFYILWSPESKELIKVGQFPSVADLHISEIKQYNKLLPPEKLREFTKAIGLAANGVGIGSFVYLRRIFEHLINEAFEKAKSLDKVKEEDYQKLRMDEKIKLLQNFLPKFLVDNNTIYSILSLGLHELDESTCLAHFDTLRVGIEIILDEKLDEFKKQEKIKSAKQKLVALKGQIKK